jgi:hypothetical protein
VSGRVSKRSAFDEGVDKTLVTVCLLFRQFVGKARRGTHARTRTMRDSQVIDHAPADLQCFSLSSQDIRHEIFDMLGRVPFHGVPVRYMARALLCTSTEYRTRYSAHSQYIVSSAALSPWPERSQSSFPHLLCPVSSAAKEGSPKRPDHDVGTDDGGAHTTSVARNTKAIVKPRRPDQATIHP